MFFGNLSFRTASVSRLIFCFAWRDVSVLSGGISMSQLSKFERPTKHIIGHIGDGFYGSSDPTNSVETLKEDFKETWHKCSSREWALLKSFSRSRGQRVIVFCVATVGRTCRYNNGRFLNIYIDIKTRSERPETARTYTGTPFSTCAKFGAHSDTRKYDRKLTSPLHDELHWLDVPERVPYTLWLLCSPMSAVQGSAVWRIAATTPQTLLVGSTCGPPSAVSCTYHDTLVRCSVAGPFLWLVWWPGTR